MYQPKKAKTQKECLAVSIKSEHDKIPLVEKKSFFMEESTFKFNLDRAEQFEQEDCGYLNDELDCSISIEMENKEMSHEEKLTPMGRSADENNFEKDFDQNSLDWSLLGEHRDNTNFTQFHHDEVLSIHLKEERGHEEMVPFDNFEFNLTRFLKTNTMVDTAHSFNFNFQRSSVLPGAKPNHFFSSLDIDRYYSKNEFYHDPSESTMNNNEKSD